MKVELSCISCIMKQAYNTAKRATDNPVIIREIMNAVADYVKIMDMNTTPADASNYVYQITRQITGEKDPYRDEKKKYNDICKNMIPRLEKIIESSENPVKTAAKISVFGNLIDLGIGLKFDLEKDIDRVLNQPFAVDDYHKMRKILDRGRKRILYLGDNTGEIIFDSLLIKELSKNHDVVFVVKKGPIINDSTREDAEFAGITKMAKVIDTGSDGIGVKWSSVSDEFLDEYWKADMIISKGHGNFETMNERKGIFFFMLRAKCDNVAEELGVSFGDIVIKMIENG